MTTRTAHENERTHRSCNRAAQRKPAQGYKELSAARIHRSNLRHLVQLQDSRPIAHRADRRQFRIQPRVSQFRVAAAVGEVQKDIPANYGETIRRRAVRIQLRNCFGAGRVGKEGHVQYLLVGLWIGLRRITMESSSCDRTITGTR